MHALVLCDDQWHPARTPRAGLGALGDSGIAFDWIEHASEWSAERMAAYPLLVLTKSNNVSSTDHQPWVTDEVQAALLEYVRGGNSLLAIHSGTVYQPQPVLRGLLGGVFVQHPKQCPVLLEPQPGHPLTAGVEQCTLVDEHYFMEMADPQVDMFLTTRSEHGEQPGGWTRSEGAGRVCVLTPGHNLEVWLHLSFQMLLHNALCWCVMKS